MEKDKQFYFELLELIVNSIYNQFNDNYSFSRFGKEKKPCTFSDRIARTIGYINANERSDIIKCIHNSSELIENAEYLYSMLEDDYSKKLLIQVLSYRLLGYKKVKLPMNNDRYFKNIASIDKSIIDKKVFIESGFNNWKLFLFDLKQFGFPCRMYFTPSGIYHKFVYRSYEYNNNKTIIKAEKGDHIIDAGACWGDTALYFSVISGFDGKVYSFEFLPQNVDIFQKNISLNPDLKDRIELIQKPLWSSSDVDVFCNNNGPGNSVTFDNKYSGESYKTITIDDFVNSNDIKKINFIKMDIEGSELEALKGAVNTLKKNKPTLAISIYHKKNDFRDIPQYIDSLNLGYKFYFDHYSIHHEESVLFARV